MSLWKSEWIKETWITLHGRVCIRMFLYSRLFTFLAFFVHHKGMWEKGNFFQEIKVICDDLSLTPPNSVLPNNSPFCIWHLIGSTWSRPCSRVSLRWPTPSWIQLFCHLFGIIFVFVIHVQHLALHHGHTSTSELLISQTHTPHVGSFHSLFSYNKYIYFTCKLCLFPFFCHGQEPDHDKYDEKWSICGCSFYFKGQTCRTVIMRRFNIYQEMYGCMLL